MSRVVRRAATVSLAAALAVSTAGPAAAQSRVRTEVDTTLVTVGDRISLTVTVEHPAGTRVAWPDSLTLAPFEILDASVQPARSAGGTVESTVRLSIAAFELGELEVPSFEIAVSGPGDEVELLETDTYGVEVVSVGTDETGEIREIRGPLWIPVGATRIVLSGLLLLVPALLAYVMYRRFRARRPEETAGVRGPPPRPAHELALEALAALEASPLLERGQVKEYHIVVSEILRTYVERRFGVDALEMTTIEVLAGLEAGGLDVEVRDGLRRFLGQCDMVKFAKARPDLGDSRAVLRLGRELVERTVPLVPIPRVDAAREGPGAAEPVDGADAPETAAEPIAAEAS